MIILAQRDRNNKRLLAIENRDKTIIAEVIKVIHLENKHGQIISNSDINAARNWEIISIKKFWKCISQIQDKVDKLDKNWIPIFEGFIKHFWKMHNNKKITKNMKIEQNINPK